jgi:hypothetical protein
MFITPFLKILWGILVVPEDYGKTASQMRVNFSWRDASLNGFTTSKNKSLEVFQKKLLKVRVRIQTIAQGKSNYLSSLR